MTQETFNTMMDAYLTQLAQKGPSSWSEEARTWAESKGIIQGDGKGNMQYESFCTREQLAEILYRLSQQPSGAK